MKSFKNALVLGALALASLGTTAFAEEATTFVTPGFKCPACGVPLGLKSTITKKGTVDMKLEQIRKNANPKSR